MNRIYITFHLQDGSSHDVSLENVSAAQAYDFAQVHALQFNKDRTADQRPDRVLEVSLRFPVEQINNGSAYNPH